MVPASDQYAETGSKRFYGGVVYLADGGLHPAKYHNCLVARVRQQGGAILSHTPVLDLKKNAAKYQLTTPRGTVIADRVAICTNGYTGAQFADLRRRVLPLRSAILATEPLSADLMAQLMPHGRM